MSEGDDVQTQPYPHEVVLQDQNTLFRVVKALLADADGHQHNFEVWSDENVVRVNESGLACVQRELERMIENEPTALNAREACAASGNADARSIGLDWCTTHDSRWDLSGKRCDAADMRRTEVLNLPEWYQPIGDPRRPHV